MGTLKNLLGALAAIFGFQRARHNANNSPEMKKNAQAKTDNEIKQDARETLKRRDPDELRRKLAE